MTLDEAIKHAEEVAYQKDLESGFDTDNERYAMTDNERTSCKKCADEHRQLAEWLKQLNEIKRILDAPSYKENGVTYSYCYDSETKLKHIREVIKND